MLSTTCLKPAARPCLSAYSIAQLVWFNVHCIVTTIIGLRCFQEFVFGDYGKSDPVAVALLELNNEVKDMSSELPPAALEKALTLKRKYFELQVALWRAPPLINPRPLSMPTSGRRMPQTSNTCLRSWSAYLHLQSLTNQNGMLISRFAYLFPFSACRKFSPRFSDLPGAISRRSHGKLSCSGMQHAAASFVQDPDMFDIFFT